MADSTVDYYEANAQRYVNGTVHVDMSDTLLRFVRHVRPGGRIADLGCGSGRDLRWFREQGFQAEGIDASAALCRLAEAHAGVPVRQIRIEDWRPRERVDGIWANASLLHLGMEAIAAFFGQLSSLLAPGGAAFFAFKSGIPTGRDGSGRFFTSFTKADLDRLLDGHPELVLLESWESRDKLERAGFVWLSFILGLKPGA
ncbi:MAG: methyltransferase domain-containing protein [Desulfovibrio sp.]|nr:methyltransferase domain-containing protein [Desulfovibrio sp.]